MIIVNKPSQSTHIYEVLDHITTQEYCGCHTGVMVDKDTKIELVFKATQTLSITNDRHPRVFSTEERYWGDKFHFDVSIENSNIQFFPLGYAGAFNTNISYNTFINSKVRLVVDCVGTLVLYDENDNILGSYDASSSIDPTSVSQQPIGLFYRYNNTDGAPPRECFGLTEVYGVKIWSGSTLLRDYVPAKRLADNVIGLYDLVTETFEQSDVKYNNADYTQPFLGTSKVVPTYIDEQIGGKRYVNNVVVLGDPIVEHVYELLDYVIAPSQSSVNTEVLVDGSVVVEMVANIASGGGSGPRLFSSNDTNTDVPGWNQPGTWGLQKEGNYLAIALFGSIYDGSVSSAVVNTNITWSSLINKKLRYNLTAAGILNVYNDDDTLFGYYDVTAYSDPTYVSSTPIKLFIRYAGHEYIPQNSKIYDIKIWKSNDLIKHYVPVKRLEDNVYGFYDLVDGTFHPNEVSGYSFSGVSKSVPEYIDKEIANPIYFNKIYHDGEVYFGG